jgi:hypothetical protein
LATFQVSTLHILEKKPRQGIDVNDGDGLELTKPFGGHHPTGTGTDQNKLLFLNRLREQPVFNFCACLSPLRVGSPGTPMPMQSAGEVHDEAFMAGNAN